MSTAAGWSMEIAIYHPNYLEPFMREILYLTKQYNVDKTNWRIVTTTIQFSLGVPVADPEGSSTPCLPPVFKYPMKTK